MAVWGRNRKDNLAQPSRNQNPLIAFAKKNLQYPKTNSLFVIPAEAGTQGSVNDEKERKPGKMGTKPTTSRPWVPACAGMTKKRLSQKGNPFADSFWQTL
jgi:hypothetical protein